jgi:uncharacterized membrane protein
VRILLWKRGLWLIILGWVARWIIFPLRIGMDNLLCMFGCAMIALAAMAKLRLKWIAATALAVIFLHNLADPITPAQFGHLAWLWRMLHVPGLIGSFRPPVLFGRFPLHFSVSYTLLPWTGVMAAGYAFGALMRQSALDRRRLLLWLGTASIVLFVFLRATNLYGNPHSPDTYTCGDFHWQASFSKTLIAFLDTEKYPASLQFLLMTLGPGFLALAALERLRFHDSGLTSWFGCVLLVFGRVPLFYYVLHLYLIHLFAIAVALALHQPVYSLLHLDASQPWTSYSHGLPFVYAMWIAVVLVLYLPCRCLMELKRRRRDWWLQYI